MLQACLKYSNNFIANQLFLYCGARRFGAPATWEKARKAMTDALLSAAGLDSGDIILAEGSGLSRKNLITPAAMITLLEKFKPWASLLSETEGIPLKSGTMTGVYGYAGYFSSNGDIDPFVILLNQQANNRDRLLKLSKVLYEGQARQGKEP
jgi:D-alanyl-D-alanine carboxypeptidase/D-alanyl-D-alanine-endopeptidase (penicillin-binding protein 4)